MVYLASPFFNVFEVAVKGNMIEEVEEEFDLTDKDLFDPEDSDASQKYGIGENDVSPKNKFEFAKAIYLDNVNGIKMCDTLVFPKFTSDLGTLWEVGYAMGLGKKIYRYNFLSRKLESVEYKPIEWKGLVDTDRRIGFTFDAVMFGVLASNEMLSPHLIYSFEKGTGFNDNIMFAANFKFKNSEGDIISPENRDWGGNILVATLFVTIRLLKKLESGNRNS